MRKRKLWIGCAALFGIAASWILAVECHAQMPPREAAPPLSPTPPPNQPPPLAPGLVPDTTEELLNTVRFMVGVSFYDSGWYSCNYFYPYYTCNNGSYGSYTPFTAGVQADIHLAANSYISPGLQAMTGTITATYFNGTAQLSNSAHMTLWEPTLDYVGKWGESDGTIGRFRVGGGLYFGSDGGNGGGFRVGIGGSFFHNRKVGLGLDLNFEGGSYHGYWLSGIVLLVSPELHF